MVRSLTFVIATFGAAAVLAAQTPYPAPAGAQPAAQQPAPQTPSPSTSASTSASANKVTWSGCLKPGTTAGTWTLESAEMPASASAASPAATAVGTSGATASKRTFNLTPKASDNLTPHANHKIEVTGTVTAASSTPSAGAAGAVDTSSASTAPRQTLAVESFKMVSATCP
jgi:hypothetical protein